MSPDAAPSGRRRAPDRASCLVGGLAGAVAALVASGQDWVAVQLPGAAPLHADGRTAAPAAVAVALVAAAGAVVLVTAGRIARLAVAVLLVLAGAGLVAASVPVWTAPLDAGAPAVSRVTGTVGHQEGATASATAWPAVSAAGGLLVVAAGALGAVRGRRWPGPSRRYERAPSGTGAGVGPGAGQGPAGATGTAGVGGVRGRDDDAWDRLSRGEDPTDDA